MSNPGQVPRQVAPPQFALSANSPDQLAGVDVVALPVLPAEDENGLSVGPGAAGVEETFGVDLLLTLERVRASGKVGEVIAVHVTDERAVAVASAVPDPAAEAEEPVRAAEGVTTVLLVGVGEARPRDLRRAGAALARAVDRGRTVATTIAAICDDDGLRAVVEGLVLGSFGFHRRSAGPRKEPASRVVLAGISDGRDRQSVVDRALAVAGAGWFARTLALVPSNEKNPAWMAERAADVASSGHLDLEVWDEKRLAAEGFGGILGVGQASATPPRLIRLSYTPSGRGRGRSSRTPHVVLVGKGITFDTGGLSIKPADAMMNMKRDMTGGGVVIAVMGALADLGCPVRVTGLVASAENAVGGSSLRPGDVIRHYGGRTSEVTNTDAEGRLVMADALAYAVEHLEPTVLVDVATLTGAVKVSLGQRTGGLFASDDALAAALVNAGEEAGEPLWRLPLAEDYEDNLRSNVADADNAPSGPGAITAALFLRHFTGGLPWAHLDIASVGDSPTDAFEYTQGATGFGARLLLRWLEQPHPVAGVAAPPSGRRGRTA